MSKIRVAVLRGGPSPAYDDSLRTGAYILSLLRETPEYEPLDIFVSREGEWHYRGLPSEPYKLLRHADVTWNAMHGSYGEDGRLHQLLEGLMVPFVGSGTLGSALSHNKDATKKIYLKHSLNTPESATIREKDLFNEEELMHIFRNYPHPVIVKPATGARAFGVRLSYTFQELKDAVKEVLGYSPKAIVEEYVRGAVVSSAIVEGVRGEEYYALMPTQLEISRKRIIPTTEEHKTMEEMARVAHQALGLRHYSSSDFIIAPSGKIYILESNSSPVFHENSLLHRSLTNSGFKPRDFTSHCINLALNCGP